MDPSTSGRGGRGGPNNGRPGLGAGPAYRPYDAYGDSYAPSGRRAPIDLPPRDSPSRLGASPAHAGSYANRTPRSGPASSTTSPASVRYMQQRQPGGASIDEPDGGPPSNPHFMEPLFPQPARTLTNSASAWAIMSEAGCQTLEAVLGPLLEGALMELFGRRWEDELSKAGLRLPPFNAAACLAAMSGVKPLQDKLPITIHKRVQAAEKAVSSLMSSPASLRADDVAAGHTVMRGVLQDCIKALKLPSLLGEGSRQWIAFTAALLPHCESAVTHFDMLLADSAEAAAAVPDGLMQ